MTTPFTQKHTEEIPINDLTPEQFLNLAIQSSRSLRWIFSNINETGFTAYTANGIFNWNAEIKLKIIDSTAKILSQSRNIRAVEFGKDKINLENFIATFNDLKNAAMPIELPDAYMNAQSKVA